MAAKFEIKGSGSRETVTVTKHGDTPTGLVAYTHPLLHQQYDVKYLVNSKFGRNAAINPIATAVTTETIIYTEGGVESWTGTDLTGDNDVNFTRSGIAGAEGVNVIDVTNFKNNDSFTLSDSPINPLSFERLMLRVNINDWETRDIKEVRIAMLSNNQQVSSSINLSDYVDTSNIGTWQVADIPMSDFIAQSSSVNAFIFTTIDQGKGSAPEYYLDSVKLISTTTPDLSDNIRFTASAAQGQKAYISSVRFTAVTTGKTELDSLEFFGIPELTKGIELVLRDDRQVFAALDARDLFSILSWGDTHVEAFGTNNNVTIIAEINLPEDTLLVDESKNQRIELIVRDDLSGITRFNVCAVLKTIQQQ